MPIKIKGTPVKKGKILIKPIKIPKRVKVKKGQRLA